MRIKMVIVRITVVVLGIIGVELKTTVRVKRKNGVMESNNGATVGVQILARAIGK